MNTNNRYKKATKAALIILAVLLMTTGCSRVENEQPVELPEPIMIETPQPPEPLPTERPAYIPGIEELSTLPALETLVITQGFTAADLDGQTLSLEWLLSEEADYYLLCILDELDQINRIEILWPDTQSWQFSNFEGASVLLLGFSDRGVDGMDDDIIVAAYLQRIVYMPEDNAEPAETPQPKEDEEKPSPKPTAKPTVKPAPEPNKYYVIVDKSKFTFAVFEYESQTGDYTKRVKQFPCALGGRSTPSGTFSIGNKGTWKTWKSGQYSPYHTSYANGLYFHGPLYTAKSFDSLMASSYNGIGTNGTAGCIRTTVEGAKWVFDNLKAGTVVEITASSDRVSKVSKPALIASQPGWDPTDPQKPALPEPTPTPTPAPTPTPTPTPTPAPTPAPTPEPTPTPDADEDEKAA